MRRHFPNIVLISLQHEQGSVDMLDHLISSNNLWTAFEDYGLTQTDLVFIKELIVGPLEPKEEEDSEVSWRYKGRTIDKSFLYEV